MSLFNKTPVSRLNKIIINLAQKGFRKTDGCLVNALLLQSVIKEYRKKTVSYHIVTLDFRKAFDTVSTYSIPRARRRIRVQLGTISSIEDMYLGCSTIVRCDGSASIPISKPGESSRETHFLLYFLISSWTNCYA